MTCFLCEKEAQQPNICTDCALKVHRAVRMRAPRGKIHLLIKRGIVSPIVVIQADPDTQNTGFVLSHGVLELEDLTGEVVIYAKHGGIQVKMGGYTIHVIEELRVQAVIG